MEQACLLIDLVFQPTTKTVLKLIELDAKEWVEFFEDDIITFLDNEPDLHPEFPDSFTRYQLTRPEFNPTIEDFLKYAAYKDIDISDITSDFIKAFIIKYIILNETELVESFIRKYRITPTKDIINAAIVNKRLHLFKFLMSIQRYDILQCLHVAVFYDAIEITKYLFDSGQVDLGMLNFYWNMITSDKMLQFYMSLSQDWPIEYDSSGRLIAYYRNERRRIIFDDRQNKLRTQNFNLTMLRGKITYTYQILQTMKVPQIKAPRLRSIADADRDRRQ